MKDIVYLGMDEWDSVPKRPRHLAMQLSATHRIIYINPCYYSAPGYLRDMLAGSRRRQGLWSIEEISPSLILVNFPPLFPKGAIFPFIGRLNYRLLIPLICHTLRHLNVQKPILWLTVPPDQFLIGSIDAALSVYDCMDRHAHFFEGRVRRLIEAEEQVMLKKVDVVITSSKRLQEYCRQYHSDVNVVRNGVDLATFLASSAGVESMPLQSLNGPVIGFVGYIGSWLDQELLQAVCQSCSEATLVLIGYVGIDLSLLRKFPNVLILGEQPYEQIPEYVRRFDVCLIPFQMNELTDAVNPIKLYEYFALGKPVVSTALPEIIPYSSVATIAHSRREFVEGVTKALREPRDAWSKQSERRQIAIENTWHQRAVAIDEILDIHLSHDAGVPGDSRHATSRGG